MTDPETMLERLVDATQLLAQPPEVQESLLPSFVVVTDELAQGYSDAYLLLAQIRNAGLIDATQQECFDRVQEVLEEMSRQGDKGTWSVEGLRSSDEWKSVRLAARSALDSLGRELRLPTLEGVTFVKSRRL